MSFWVTGRRSSRSGAGFLTRGEKGKKYIPNGGFYSMVSGCEKLDCFGYTLPSWTLVAAGPQGGERERSPVRRLNACMPCLANWTYFQTKNSPVPYAADPRSHY